MPGKWAVQCNLSSCCNCLILLLSLVGSIVTGRPIGFRGRAQAGGGGCSSLKQAASYETFPPNVVVKSCIVRSGRTNKCTARVPRLPGVCVPAGRAWPASTTNLLPLRSFSSISYLFFFFLLLLDRHLCMHTGARGQWRGAGDAVQTAGPHHRRRLQRRAQPAALRRPGELGRVI